MQEGVISWAGVVVAVTAMCVMPSRSLVFLSASQRAMRRSQAFLVSQVDPGIGCVQVRHETQVLQACTGGVLFMLEDGAGRGRGRESGGGRGVWD